MEEIQRTRKQDFIQMKKFKIIYSYKFSSEIRWIIELLNDGITEKKGVGFYNCGAKHWQSKFKNNRTNGLSKTWFSITKKNATFSNWKKTVKKGIQIRFKH